MSSQVSKKKEFDLGEVSRALEGDENVVISLDIDNPVKEPGPFMEPHEGVIKGIEQLLQEADSVTFNSGKPVDYQRELRERYAEESQVIEDVDLIGGMGTVAELDGEIYHFGGKVDESLMDFLEVEQSIISVIAENGWKANMQNNRSYDVGVTRVEAENGEPHSQGYSRANPLFSHLSTDDLYSEYFEEAEGFEFIDSYSREFSDEAIFTHIAPDNMNYLTEVARVEEPFIGLRFEEHGNGIVFYRDERDRKVETEKVRSELEDAVRDTDTDWNIVHHGDGGTEYWKPGMGKEQGLERYLELKYDGDAVAVHIGDSESDWIETDRITSVPQYGTELYEKVKPDHSLEPRDVSDFSDMIARTQD